MGALIFGLILLFVAVVAWLEIKGAQERRAKIAKKDVQKPEIEDDEDLGQGPFYALLKTWDTGCKNCRVCVFNHLRCFCYVLSDDNSLVEALCPPWTYPPDKVNKRPEFLKSFGGIQAINLPDTMSAETRKKFMRAQRRRSLACKTIYCSTYFHARIKKVSNRKEKLKKFKSATLSALLTEVQHEIDSRLTLEGL